MLSSERPRPSVRRIPVPRVAAKPRWRIPDLLARARQVELDLVEMRVIEPELERAVGLWARERAYRLNRRG